MLNDTSHLVEGIAQAATCKNLEVRTRVKGKLDKMKFIGVCDLQFWHENKLKYINFVVIICALSKLKLSAPSKR
jgi:hypothetical protein